MGMTMLTILLIVMALSANKITMEVEEMKEETIMIMTIMVEEEDKVETTIMIMIIMVEEEDEGVMEEEDLEMVEEEEAMVPKIAKILNVNKSILREDWRRCSWRKQTKLQRLPMSTDF